MEEVYNCFGRTRVASPVGGDWRDTYYRRSGSESVIMGKSKCLKILEVRRTNRKKMSNPGILVP